MLLDNEALAVMIRRNQLDLEAISEGYKGSQSLTWLTTQIDFLDRLEASSEEMLAKLGAGPLHPMRTHLKVMRNLRSDVLKRLDKLRKKNQVRAARTQARAKDNKAIADFVRTRFVMTQPEVIARASDRSIARSEIAQTIQKQLGSYDPLASPEDRARALLAGADGISQDASKQQADELDAIFSIKPEDMKG